MTSWTVNLNTQAQKDLNWFRRHNKKLYVRCYKLTMAVEKNPFKGIGKPEHLRYLGNVWSRRVNIEHRMVCEVFDNLIVVASYRHHY